MKMVNAAKLSGRIHIGPDIDYLERAFDAAKYGDYSPAPYMDITIPSLTDPRLLRRRHSDVDSRSVCAVQVEAG